MKNSVKFKNCGASSKMQQNRKNNFGNIFKKYFKHRQYLPVFADFLKFGD